MNILHSSTDPTLLARLKKMLTSAYAADIAVGYFFMSGFQQVANDLAGLDKVRILVGRTDRQVLEQVALGLQQTEALRARLDSDGLLPRRQRATVTQESVERIAEGVALLPQDAESQEAVSTLRDMVASGQVEVRSYPRGHLHAKPTSAGTPITPNRARRLWALPISLSLASLAIPNSTSASQATPRWTPFATGSSRSGKTRLT